MHQVISRAPPTVHRRYRNIKILSEQEGGVGYRRRNAICDAISANLRVLWQISPLKRTGGGPRAVDLREAKHTQIRN